MLNLRYVAFLTILNASEELEKSISSRSKRKYALDQFEKINDYKNKKRESSKNKINNVQSKLKLKLHNKNFSLETLLEEDEKSPQAESASKKNLNQVIKAKPLINIPANDEKKNELVNFAELVFKNIIKKEFNQENLEKLLNTTKLVTNLYGSNENLEYWQKVELLNNFLPEIEGKDLKFLKKMGFTNFGNINQDLKFLQALANLEQKLEQEKEPNKFAQEVFGLLIETPSKEKESIAYVFGLKAIEKFFNQEKCSEAAYLAALQVFSAKNKNFSRDLLFLKNNIMFENEEKNNFYNMTIDQFIETLSPKIKNYIKEQLFHDKVNNVIKVSDFVLVNGKKLDIGFFLGVQATKQSAIFALQAALALTNYINHEVHKNNLKHMEPLSPQEGIDFLIAIEQIKAIIANNEARNLAQGNKIVKKAFNFYEWVMLRDPEITRQEKIRELLAQRDASEQAVEKALEARKQILSLDNFANNQGIKLNKAENGGLYLDQHYNYPNAKDPEKYQINVVKFRNSDLQSQMANLKQNNLLSSQLVAQNSSISLANIIDDFKQQKLPEIATSLLPEFKETVLETIENPITISTNNLNEEENSNDENTLASFDPNYVQKKYSNKVMKSRYKNNIDNRKKVLFKLNKIFVKKN